MPGNGRFVSAASIDDELRAVESEITVVEAAGPPLADRLAELETEYGRAEPPVVAMAATPPAAVSASAVLR